jgi:hypothetical protein
MPTMPPPRTATSHRSDYLYVWAEGIHLNVRLEEAKTCVFVLTRVRADRSKELVASRTATANRVSPGRTRRDLRPAGVCTPWSLRSATVPAAAVDDDSAVTTDGSR